MSNERFFVVDRIEGQHVVLVGDDEAEVVIPRGRLPVRVREGTVLRVQCADGRVPDWSTARADAAEQARRIAAVKRKMDELRDSDPGGDLEL